jgi:hypothetical protein
VVVSRQYDKQKVENTREVRVLREKNERGGRVGPLSQLGIAFSLGPCWVFWVCDGYEVKLFFSIKSREGPYLLFFNNLKKYLQGTRP